MARAKASCSRLEPPAAAAMPITWRFVWQLTASEGERETSAMEARLTKRHSTQLTCVMRNGTSTSLPRARSTTNYGDQAGSTSKCQHSPQLLEQTDARTRDCASSHCPHAASLPSFRTKTAPCLRGHPKEPDGILNLELNV